MSQSIKFVCPSCAAEHERGYLDGVSTFRCLRCSYIGHGFHSEETIDRALFEEHEATNKWQREHGLAEENLFEDWEPGRSSIRHSLGLLPGSELYSRCNITGNPCGTDTWGNGVTCGCSSCQKWVRGNGIVIADKQVSPEVRLPSAHPLAWWSTISNPWRDAVPKCNWSGGCSKVGTKWIARHVLYCDEHGSPFLQDAPWAELARAELKQ